MAKKKDKKEPYWLYYLLSQIPQFANLAMSGQRLGLQKELTEAKLPGVQARSDYQVANPEQAFGRGRGSYGNLSFDDLFNSNQAARTSGPNLGLGVQDYPDYFPQNQTPGYQGGQFNLEDLMSILGPMQGG